MFGSAPFGSAPFGALGGVSPVEVAVGDSLAIAVVPTAEWYRAIADSLGVAAGVVTQPGIGISDSLNIAAGVQAGGLLLQLVSDNAAFQLAAVQVWDAAISDAIQLVDDAVTLRTLLAVVADRLRLTGAAPTELHAVAAVIAGVALADLANPGFEAAIADSIGFADAALAIGTLLATAEATLAIADGAVGALRLVVALDDAIALDPIAATQLTAVQAVEDGFTVGLTLRIGEDEYFAWVLHTQPVDRAGTRPVTQYRNFPFNSFATEDGVELAAGPGGIYELEGDDDAGDAIPAWIRSGLTNFGTDNHKRLPEMFIALRADSDIPLYVKVVHTDPNTGARTEDWYYLEEVRNEGMTRQTRAKLAQGLKSAFWGYELRNIDGADFAISDLRLYPLVLEGKL